MNRFVKSGVCEFNLDGKSTGQSTKIIEAEAIGLVDLALKLNKPIVLEKLNTTKFKVSNPYGNKTSNRKMSAFAYNKLITAIKNRSDKMGVAVYDVNPAYTSQTGKMKYTKRLGISIHQAASYVIARRAMGFKEKTSTGVAFPVTREDDRSASLGAVEARFEPPEKYTCTYVLPIRTF